MHDGTEATSTLVQRLRKKDPAIVEAALKEASRLEPKEADYKVVTEVADVLWRFPALRELAWDSLMALAERGTDMSPVFWVCVRALHKDPTATWALRWLREARSHSHWAPVCVGGLSYELAEMVAKRPGSPEAAEAVEWLELKAKTFPRSVAVDLELHWPDQPGKELLEIVRRLEAIDPQAAAVAVPKKPDYEPMDYKSAMAQPLDLEATRARVPRDASPLLVAEGQFSPASEAAVRVGVLCCGKVLADLWVPPAILKAMPGALAERAAVRRGEWDVLYATGYSVAWTTDGVPFELWDWEGPLASQNGDMLTVRGFTPCLISDIECIEAYIGTDWVNRGVRCRLKSGKTIPIAEANEVSAAIDPTYDGLDLLVDASWVSSLAWAMGEALGLTVKRDKALGV